MLGRSERPHLGCRRQWIADTDRRRQGYEPFEEFAGDALMENDPTTGYTGLTLVVEDGEGSAVHRCRDGSIFEDDVRPLASQLKLYSLEVAC